LRIQPILIINLWHFYDYLMILSDHIRSNGLYAGQSHYARKVFDKFTHPNVFLWNVIIRGYSRHKFFHRPVEMYSRMQLSCVCPDKFIYFNL
jgi:pentatricopeptide repeat protein